MWLGHFIEHLMCIGGELEHPNALPSPASKKQSTVECSARWRWAIYRQIICPGSWLEPGPMVMCQERGPLLPVRS